MSDDMFMRIEADAKDDTVLAGETRDSEHKNWIDIFSWSFGASQAIGAPPHRTTGRGSNSDLTISKNIDSLSPKLWIKCLKGEHLFKVTINNCKAVGNTESKNKGSGRELYFKIELEDAIITSINQSGSGSLSESVSFNPKNMIVTYTKTASATGSGQGNISANWDQVDAKGE